MPEMQQGTESSPVLMSGGREMSRVAPVGRDLSVEPAGGRDGGQRRRRRATLSLEMHSKKPSC